MVKRIVGLLVLALPVIVFIVSVADEVVCEAAA
jgi:hypothetical protein